MTTAPEATELGAARYLLRRAAKHWTWARMQGVQRLIEEDELNPVSRSATALRKLRWRLVHGQRPGSAVPVYLVGVQRSGTNMLARGLAAAPEFEVHNENDRRAFRRYRFRSDERIAALVNDSRHRYVLFKPLCDSHDIARLLDALPVPPGRAIWAYRDVDDRARSAVAKFGAANLQAMRAVASGDAVSWQAQRLSETTLAALREFDYAAMTSETAAALFWWARNSLVFDLALTERDDVLLCSYDALIAHPEPTMRTMCTFLRLPYTPQLVAHVERRTAGPGRQLPIDPGVRELCDALGKRLDAAAGRLTATPPAGQWQAVVPESTTVLAASSDTNRQS